MEIRFTEHVEGETVPEDLVSLAAALGVPLRYVDQGVIVPAEAVQLYAALTGFSAEMQAHLIALERSAQLSVPLVCYAVHHGVWERREVEAVLLTTPRPASLLAGQSRPEQRHLYLQDLVYGRAALLFGSLDRRLRYRSHPQGESTVHLEDDERPLESRLDGTTYAVTYCSPEEAITLPWVLAAPGGEAGVGMVATRVPAGQLFTVLIRARDKTDLALHLTEDLRQAGLLYQPAETGPVYVLVPRDLERLPESTRLQMLRDRPHGVGLMVYRDFTSTLDAEVMRRLKTSGVMRA
jgi:hypothetical protein